MAIRGNILSINGNSEKIAGAVMGSIAGTTYTTVGSTSNYISNYNGSLFSYSSGVFTCVKPGTYTMQIYIRGTYNSNGNEQNCRYRVYVNGTQVSSGSAARAGGTFTYNATLTTGDTIYTTEYNVFFVDTGTGENIR